MFSNPPNLLRSFAFRLSLWYALIFTISTAALLVLVYYLVAHEFQGKDQEIILAKLKEYAAALPGRRGQRADRNRVAGE